MACDVFISFASADSAIAFAVRDALAAKGLESWVAPRNIAPGDKWGREIIAAIRDCRLVVLVLTQRTNESEWVALEAEQAVSRRKPILTFRVEPVEPSDVLSLYISSRQYVDAAGGPWERYLPALVEAAIQVLEGRRPDPVATVPRGIGGGRRVASAAALGLVGAAALAVTFWPRAGDSPAGDPAAAPGFVSLEVAPWAEVRAVRDTATNALVEAACDATPCFMPLPRGRYEVTVANPHFASPLALPVEVASGETTRVRETLPGFDHERYLSALAP